MSNLQSIKSSKNKALRDLLHNPGTSYIMEAHNGLSAKLVEQAGFNGIWGSGFTISSSLGVRDRNELTWTQVFDAVEYMTDVTDIPVLLDVDTGYGDFNTFSRVVKKLNQKGVSGACIEDKIFPKQNSFMGGRQPLASIPEFVGKIKAGVDSKLDEDFSIVARVEALIAGHGMDEALRRADAYYEAGADAILIHSKQTNADEILEFCRRFQAPCPIVIVPTKYYVVPTEVFEEAGVSLVIWANHSLRSSVQAMQKTIKTIYTEKSLISVEKNITTMGEIFNLTGEYEMEALEKKYLQSAGVNTNAVYLAATRGSGLKELTMDKPKSLVSVNDKPLFKSTLDSLHSRGIEDVTVVSGYKSERFDCLDVNNVVNPEYENSGEVFSLSQAMDKIEDDTLIGYGDVMVSDYIIDLLLNDSHSEVVIVADKSTEHLECHNECFVQCNKAYSRNPLENEDVRLSKVTTGNVDATLHGQWIGLLKVNGKGADKLKAGITTLMASEHGHTANLVDLFTLLLEQGCHIRVIYVHGDWIDINTALDLKLAEARTS